MGDYIKVSRKNELVRVVGLDLIELRHIRLGLNMKNCDTQSQGSIRTEG